MPEKRDFNFRYQPTAKSVYLPLLEYLDSKETEFPKTKMILWALFAYWYPFACQWSEQYSQVELQQKARNAIYQLLQQVDMLAQAFGLEIQDLRMNSGLNEPRIVPTVLTPPGLTTEPTPEVNQHQATEIAAQKIELLHGQDDELLNELCN